MNIKLKTKAISGIKWQALNLVGCNVLQFVSSIVIARIIAPSQYGLIAMTAIFISVCHAIANCGLHEGLIRKTERDQTDCTSVFVFNIIAASLLYLLLFFTAPVVSHFYGDVELTTLLRVSSLSIIIASAAIVHSSLLVSALDFKKKAIINLSSIAISCTAGVITAYYNFQAWALVLQNITYVAVNSILTIASVSWKPDFSVSFTKLRQLLKFGSKLTFSSILNIISTQIYTVAIGKHWTPATVGLYNKADNLSGTLVKLTTGIIDNVVFASLAHIKDNRQELHDNYRKTIKLAAFTVFPVALGIGAVAYPLISVLLTEKWLGAAQYMQILAFAFMLFPIHALNLNLLKVAGRSDLFLKLEILKTSLIAISLLITLPMGITAMCYAQIAVSFAALFINTYYTGRIIGVGILKQLQDIFPSFILATAIFFICRRFTLLFSNDLISLALSILIGAVTYIACAWLFKFKELSFLKSMLRG